MYSGDYSKDYNVPKRKNDVEIRKKKQMNIKIDNY